MLQVPEPVLRIPEPVLRIPGAVLRIPEAVLRIPGADRHPSPARGRGQDACCGGRPVPPSA
ncbi:hypothetical protein GCM10009676_08300 [Prauserella halophila]|uniref:Uncharacterized protein n=1 Tax=Prauserella halophila TaxID=185641 RepID=A0ABN1VZ97_9PSEU